jgi:hypothetical protein
VLFDILLTLTLLQRKLAQTLLGRHVYGNVQSRSHVQVLYGVESSRHESQEMSNRENTSPIDLNVPLYVCVTLPHHTSLHGEVFCGLPAAVVSTTHPA